MKNKVFMVLAVFALIASTVACGLVSTPTPAPTYTPYPSNTPWPTYTYPAPPTPVPTLIVPTATKYLPPATVAAATSESPIPEECISPETIQYLQAWKQVDNRFTQIYLKVQTDDKSLDVVGLSNDHADMLQLIQDTLALQPPKLFKTFHGLFLSEEQAFADSLGLLLVGKTDEADAKLAEQRTYNQEGIAELKRINDFCGFQPQPTIESSNG